MVLRLEIFYTKDFGIYVFTIGVLEYISETSNLGSMSETASCSTKRAELTSLEIESQKLEATYSSTLTFDGWIDPDPPTVLNFAIVACP
jgi:hypothetical protein